MLDLEEAVRRRDEAFGAGALLFYQRPIKIVRGEGVHLFDEAGRRYLDVYNNVPCVGHSHPAVVEAVCKQLTLVNVHSRYLHDGAIEFAERLSGLHAENINAVLFSCSGTEAIECALRMARIVTGNSGIICSNWAYHGNSELVSTLSYLECGSGNQSNFVRAFPFPDTYRPLKKGLTESQLGDLYVEQVALAIHQLKEAGQKVAAFLACSIFANEGLPRIPLNFMARAAELVRKAGGFVIADEVQAGYVRTGRWWGYEASNFIPDIVVMGKPMGNGIPVSATATSREIMNTFRQKTGHFNTFASSPVQAAAGLAVVDVIERDGLPEKVSAVGKEFLRRVIASTKDKPFVGDVRGQGLFLGIDIVKPGTDIPDEAAAARICEKLKEDGVLCANAGPYKNIIKIRPPIVFSMENLDEFMSAWSHVMDYSNND